MLKLYIIGLSCVIFIMVHVLYNKYVSKTVLNPRELFYNTIVMGLSIYASFELLMVVLPSVGLNVITGATTGKTVLNVFTNEPSF